MKVDELALRIGKYQNGIHCWNRMLGVVLVFSARIVRRPYLFFYLFQALRSSPHFPRVTKDTRNAKQLAVHIAHSTSTILPALVLPYFISFISLHPVWRPYRSYRQLSLHNGPVFYQYSIVPLYGISHLRRVICTELQHSLVIRLSNLT